MRIVKFLMIALFVWACYLNLNDSDGVFWIILYGMAALITGASLVRSVRGPAFAAFVAFAIAAIVISIGVDRWHVDSERAREAVGIAICAAWMLILGRFSGVRAIGRG